MTAAAMSHDIGLDAVWAVLRQVPDPEIPALSICDLGIVREVHMAPTLEVVLTPTYAGCPATKFIEQSVLDALHAHGYAQVRVTTTLAPPWTTDWISMEGRAKLKAYGIAPPGAMRPGGAQVIRFAPSGVVPARLAAAVASGASSADLAPAQAEANPACPLCDSSDTELLSQFGSTACKALYRCVACREPFDYFKPY